MNCSRDLQHDFASDDNYASLLPARAAKLPPRTTRIPLFAERLV